MLGTGQLGDIILGSEGAEESSATNAYAQAQALIKQAYVSHAQAQAFIKQTYYTSAQSNAFITTGVTASGQAQATILNTYNQHGQAQGQIKQIYTQVSQTQSIISNTYTQVAQAQSYIIGIVHSHGQAQSRILRTYYSVGQAQGEIPGTGTVTYTHGQAQAYLFVTKFLDTFTKTVSSVASADDLNSPDIGYDYQSFPNSDLSSAGTLAINGSQLEIDIFGTPDFEYFRITNKKTQIYNAEVTADFYQSSISGFATYGQVGFLYGDNFGGNNPAGSAAIYDGYFELFENPTYTSTPFTPIAGTTYRIKIQRMGTTLKGKVWDVSSPEPDWMLSITIIGSSPVHPMWYQDTGEGPSAVVIRADNFRVLSDKVAIAAHGNARAFILAPKAHGQARAQIKAVRRLHGQARAKISTTRVYAQTQTRIKNNYSRLAQAQALLSSEVKNIYGQSNALIDSIIKQQMGQANAKIDNPSYYLVDDFNRSGALTTYPTPDYGSNWHAYNLFTGSEDSIDNAILDGTSLTVTGNSSYVYIWPRNDSVTGKNVEIYAEATVNTNDYIEFAIKEDTNQIVYAWMNTLYGWTLNASSNPISILTDAQRGIYPLVFGRRYSFRLRAIDSRVRFKIWETAYPEPEEWFLTLENSPASAAGGQVGFWLEESGGTQTQYMHLFNAYVAPYENFAQAQATIAAGLFIRAEVGQAQAYIKSTVTGFGQAQSHIFRYELYGQSAAIIKQIYYNVSQSNAYILTHRRWFSQARASILLTGSNSPNKTGQAQAFISQGPRAIGQARAYVTGGVNYLLVDSFSRYDTAHLGTPDIGPDWFDDGWTYLYGQSELDESSIDGSHLVTTSSEDYGYIFAINPVNVRDIVMTFDFKLSVIRDWASVFDTRVRMPLAANDGGVNFYSYYDATNDNMAVYGPFTNTTMPKIDNDTWYRVKVSVQGPPDNTLAKLRVWKVSDSEPVTWLLEETLVSVTDEGGVNFYADVGEPGGQSTSHYYDNIQIVGDSSPLQYIVSAQSMAFIGNRALYAQARAVIKLPRVHAQALAHIKRFNFNIYAQAQVYIITTPVIYRYYTTGQSAALIKQTQYLSSGLSRAFISKTQGSGQALGVINAFGQNRYGNAQAYIRRTDTIPKTGQAQASVKRDDPTGQAQAFISGGRYLVKFNGFQLPGYAGVEAINSVTSITAFDVTYEDTVFSEYVGLQNKLVSLEHTVIGESYIDVKNQAQEAATIIRSKKGWAKLYVQDGSKYYHVIGAKIATDKVVGTSMKVLRYQTEFEVKPWLISDAEYSISGTGTINTDQVGRDINDGSWTPATVIVSGTDVTISGYTSTGDFAGFVSISGTVSNLVIDTDRYTAQINGVNSNQYMNNPNYGIYVGTGKTIYDITGASNCVITWHNRWHL